MFEFELILEVMQPGIRRVWLLEDGHAMASSHVPGLFRGTDDSIQLHWSTPWPLGLVEIDCKSSNESPFSSRHV